MATDSILALNSTILDYSKEWTPTDLSLSAKNLKAAGATAYSSGVIDVSNFRQFQLSLVVAMVGAVSAGAAKLTVTYYATDGTTAISPATDVITAISTQTNGLVAIVGWGGPLAAAAINGTVGTGFGALRIAPKIKVTLTVSTQSDAATSCTGSVYMYAN